MTTLEIFEFVTTAATSGSQGLQAAWSQIPEIARSLSSAAVGVVFGAWVASRAQTKRTIVAELHALRAAHTLCFSIANKALSLKKQHLRQLKLSLDEAFAAHAQYIANPHGVFALKIDLRAMANTEFPAAALEKIILDKCFLGSEGIATLIAVTDATHDLKTSLTLRNELVVEFRNDAPATHEERIARYFGIAAGDQRDERIRNNVGALYAQADDCIFFARRLSDHVLRSENNLRKKNFWKYRLPGRKLKPASWARAEHDDLLPLDADYVSWTSGFVKDPTLLDRLWDWIRRFRGKRHG
jgi:hypothetical protein